MGMVMGKQRQLFKARTFISDRHFELPSFLDPGPGMHSLVVRHAEVMIPKAKKPSTNQICIIFPAEEQDALDDHQRHSTILALPDHFFRNEA